MLLWPRVATDLVEIDQEQPSPEALDRAAAFVRRGKVVAIPTDALYTLVADPFNLKAIQQVFIAKGREINRSLPMLVADALGYYGLRHPAASPDPGEATQPRTESVTIANARW